MSDTPGDMAAKLEAICGGFLSPLPPAETDAICAAASLLRDMSELLAPMAACAKQVPEWVEDRDWFVFDGEGMDSVECRFPAEVLRRAAKVLEPK